MVPYPPLPRDRAHASRLLRLPAFQSAVQASALLAAVLAGVALGTRAWLAVGVAGVGLAAAGVATVHLRNLNRELRQALRARAEWERRHSRLYDGVAVGIFRAEPHCRVIGANRGLCTLLGYRSEADLLAADFAEHAYVGPGTFEAVLLRARAHGALENLEMRLRRFDGLTVTVLATIESIWDEAGEVVAFEGTTVDVTRERLAESQRRSMERRFRRLFDVSAVGMLVGNLRRGTLEEANPALIELLGLRPSALPVPLAKLVPADQRPLHRGMRAALEAHGTAGPVPVEYLGADGGRVPVLLSAAMVEPQYGEFVGVIVNRAPEMAAARRAAHLQALYESLLEELPTPLATFDGERRLTRCNRALCQLLGVSRPPLGDDLAGLLGHGSVAAVAEAAARAVGGETIRLAVEPERGGSGRRLDLTLIPHRLDSATSAAYLVVLQEGSGPAGPRTSAADVACAAGQGGGDCLEGRRSA